MRKKAFPVAKRERGRGPGAPERRLADLVSVGPATLRDLSALGIETAEQLAREEPAVLYAALCRERGVRVDPCCEDVFAAAIAQARDPDLPPERRQWWYWSRVRKSRPAGERPGRRRRVPAGSQARGR